MSLRAGFLITAAVITAVVFSSVRTFAAYDDHIRLRVDGKNIVTSQLSNPPSQVFLARGTLVYPDNRGGRFEHAARFIKKSSLNTARFMFKATNTNYQTHDANYNFDSTMALINDWLTIARRYGIYTILDNHEYLGHSSAHYPTPEVFEAWKTNYRRLAEAVKDNPWVIGFELMNEVFTHRMTREEIDAELRECALRIREVDSAHILFIGHKEIDDPSYFDVLDPPQVAICPHDYSPGRTSGWQMPLLWDEGRTTGNYPVLSTEVGGGLGGNGCTYAFNKKWFTEFLQAVDSLKIGWINTYYNVGFTHNNASPDRNNPEYFFPTVYGPDDPDIWYPVAVAAAEKSFVPNNGTPVRIGFDSIPEWFSGFVATDDEVQLILRAVDTTGSMVTGSNAPVTVSVTGSASLSNVPTAFTNGRATVTLRSSGTPGAITVSASSGNLSGTYPLVSAKTWTGFQARKQDNSWADSGSATDSYSPVCRVTAHHPSKGINMNTVRYEYSTDGGDSWVYWDDDEGDEFSGSSLNTAKWTSVNHNTAGGSAAVSGGALTINAAGENVWSTWENNWYVTNTYAKDEFTYAYESRTGEFEVVTKILSHDAANPRGLAGIMVRDTMEDTRYNGYCYVAANPDSGYVFAWKELGRQFVNGGDKSNFKYIDARVFKGSVTYPCYLKLSKVKHPAYYDGFDPDPATSYNRRFHIYSAWYSTDGLNWVKIKSRYVTEAGQTQLVGPFACSGVSGTYGNAVFDFYRVGLKATYTGAADHDMYSSGAEQFQTKAIPFENSSNRQEVRFRVNTAVPLRDFMDNPGEELVSPRYAVFDGEYSAAGIAGNDRALSGVRAVSAQGAVHVKYNISRESVRDMRVSVYDMGGRRVWVQTIQRLAQSGTLVWHGPNSASVPAGSYIVRMEARMADSGRDEILQTRLIHMGK